MKRPAVAVVDERRCIGCARCIDACPVDAIVGAEGLLHTVVESWCIGCALCLPPCPVDCIDMLAPRAAWTSAEQKAAGRRGRARKARLRATEVVPLKDRRAALAKLLGKRK